MNKNKECEIIELSNVVRETLLYPNLTQQPLYKTVNWKEQLIAITNFIPIAGGFISAELQILANYQVSEFFRKFTSFIYGLKELDDSKRVNFITEVEEKAQDSSGNVMISIIDKLDNINKQKILANLVIARTNNDISIEDFFRLSSVLERIPYVDLQLLPSYQDEFYDESGDTELLFSTGVLRQAYLGEDGDRYILSPLGIKLLKFGVNVDIPIPQITGVKTGISWENVGDKDIDLISDANQEIG